MVKIDRLPRRRWITLLSEMWDQVTASDWVAYTTLNVDLGRSRFQLTDNKPVGKQPHKKNHRAERETWNIRPAPLDQQSDCEWCDDAREVAGEIEFTL